MLSIVYVCFEGKAILLTMARIDYNIHYLTNSSCTGKLCKQIPALHNVLGSPIEEH